MPDVICPITSPTKHSLDKPEPMDMLLHSTSDCLVGRAGKGEADARWGSILVSTCTMRPLCTPKPTSCGAIATLTAGWKKGELLHVVALAEHDEVLAALGAHIAAKRTTKGLRYFRHLMQMPQFLC